MQTKKASNESLRASHQRKDKIHSLDMSSCFVTTMPLERAEKLRHDLLDKGFSLSCPAHTLFSAHKQGISCTLYLSGKLCVQGKDKDDFIRFYLEPEILQTLSYSHPEHSYNMTPRIGIDESGKGDFFGSLCIAGIFADATGIEGLLDLGVRDSKKMTDSSILTLSKKICSTYAHTIVRISPRKYNTLYAQFKNLNHLLAWGHATAIENLVQKTGCVEVLIDQFADERVVENALRRKHLSVQLKQRHKAEEDPVVAAASILARAAFVEDLEKLGATVQIKLPKGASADVVRIGKQLVAKQGPGVLEGVAKLHFKTRELIL